MAALKLTIVLFACMVALAACSPAPFFGKKSEHVVVHVPYKVHTIHHHHVEKVPIYKEIPVIKHVPYYKEVHVPVVKEVHVPVHVPEYKGWSNAGWSNSGWW